MLMTLWYLIEHKVVMFGHLIDSPNDVRSSNKPDDRRAHVRRSSTMLGVSSVRIPRRPAVSIVDLSAGGALLELPFAMPPESRFPMELHTSAEHIEVPFQLLRCYVAKLNGGVVYRAAGAFEHLVDLDSLASRAATALQRLIGTLERL